MKKYIDSEIVELNNEKYRVYLKQIPVRKGKNGEINTIVRPFVKKIKRGKKPKNGKKLLSSISPLLRN